MSRTAIRVERTVIFKGTVALDGVIKEVAFERYIISDDTKSSIIPFFRSSAKLSCSSSFAYADI